MSRTNRKKLLLLCTPFFGYYKFIISELEQLGFEVDYFNDRPSERQIQIGLIRLFPVFASPSIIKYFKSIVNETSSQNYDVILIINNKVLTEDFLADLHLNHPHAYFIFYTWDSVRFYPSTISLLSYFDIAYSFDQNDCSLDKRLNHLPLFYTHHHQNIGEMIYGGQVPEFKYDISHIGTAHPNRYAIHKALIPYLQRQGMRLFTYMYIQPTLFVFYKLFVSEFKKAKLNEFHFKGISDEQIVEIYKQSKAVLDIPFSGQSGLTMRTIETLGAKRKLITFNKNIKTYDFYNENNILILDQNNWASIPEFMNKDYVQIDPITYKKYSIANWTKTLLETWLPDDSTTNH